MLAAVCLPPLRPLGRAQLLAGRLARWRALIRAHPARRWPIEIHLFGQPSERGIVKFILVDVDVVTGVADVDVHLYPVNYVFRALTQKRQKNIKQARTREGQSILVCNSK